MMGFLKWVGYLVGGLLLVIVVGVGVVYAVTSSRMGKTYSTTVEPVAVPTDSASVARGRHLAEAVGKCQNCHGDSYGGQFVFNAPVFARLTAPNLTAGKGGIGRSYTDHDWVRALRYGVGRDNKSLIFMPSESFTNLNDQDLGQIIAYMKTLPPVDASVERVRSMGPISRIIYLTSGFPLIPASMIPADLSRNPVPEGNTAEYGKYLADAGSCKNCHGDHFGGSRVENTNTPNLTPAGELGHWSEADFAKAIRTGVRPDGRILSAVMPWPKMGGLTDQEVSAMWKYLQSVPPVAPKK